MEFAEVLKAYLEVGMLGICAIMMIVLFYQNHKHNQNRDVEKDKWIKENNGNINKKLDTMIDTIQKQNDILIENQEKHFQEQLNQSNQLVTAIINGITRHVPSPEENDKLMMVNREIDSALQMMINKTGASRASLVQYHNGGKGINKQSFLKMSMTNEKVNANTKPFASQFKDQFRSTLAYMVNEISDTGYCYISNLEEIKQKDVSMYEFMKSRGIKAKFGYGITSQAGSVIAFLCIEYENNNSNPIDVKVIDDCFKEHHRTFDSLLNLKFGE